MTDSMDNQPSTPQSPSLTPNLNPIQNQILLLHPRREPFEHGLLPIPKLIFTEPTQTLSRLKHKLSNSRRVDPTSLSDALQIPENHARLVLDTLSSILHHHTHGSEPDCSDLLLFLYIQSYKKLVPRSVKDAAAVGDVWPSTSAFDGYLCALSPLQVVPRSV